MKRLVAATLAVLFMTAGGADAELPMPYAKWEAKSSMPSTLQNVTVSNDVQGVCGRGVMGCTAIHIRVLALQPLPEGKRWAFHHEQGHFFDYDLMSEHHRSVIARIIGRPEQPWIDYGTNEYGVGLNEVFADLYGTCADGTWLSPTNVWALSWGNVDTGIRLTSSQIVRGCRYIQRIGGMEPTYYNKWKHRKLKRCQSKPRPSKCVRRIKQYKRRHAVQ